MSIAALRITKRFDDFVALDDVSVEVPDGSLTALLPKLDKGTWSIAVSWPGDANYQGASAKSSVAVTD